MLEREKDMSNKTLSEKTMELISLARDQGGFFTASQAEEIGFNSSNHHRFVSDGRWIRVRRGIFRLSTEEENNISDLQILSLFFRSRDGSPSGVIGLESAAALLEIGDFMPGKITMLVTNDFRKSASIPDGVELEKTDSIEKNVINIRGVWVTDAIRTIIDLLIHGRDPEEIRRAFVSARRSGVISKRSLMSRLENEREDLADKIKSWEESFIQREG